MGGAGPVLGLLERAVSDTHDCPGGCGAQVPRHHLACPRCWSRLPAYLRDPVNAAYRTRRSNPGAHRSAVSTAVTWYRNNPRSAA